MAHAHPTTPLDALWQAPVIIWTMLAGEGLAAVLAVSATAFAVLKWAGVAYLVYLGLTALRAPAGALPAAAAQAPAWRRVLRAPRQRPGGLYAGRASCRRVRPRKRAPSQDAGVSA